jgi:hypothetical protein
MKVSLMLQLKGVMLSLRVLLQLQNNCSSTFKLNFYIAPVWERGKQIIILNYPVYFFFSGHFNSAPICLYISHWFQ